MQMFGRPQPIAHMVRQPHDRLMTRVTDNGAVPEAFAMSNEMKRGRELPPTLFGRMSTVMLLDAYRDDCPGIRIAYRTDERLLDCRQMKTTLCLSTATVHDIPFTDDCPLTKAIEEVMQWSMNLFASGCFHF
ncbi:hypothetical protein SprV_0602088800 [Sparganum proliferum]